MRAFTVDEKGSLLAYLFKVLAGTKKTRIKQFLKFKSVSVNGTISTRFDHPLGPGDRVSVATAQSEKFKPSPAFGVEIVYEDDSLVVINKPAGLLTIATEKVQTRTAFYSVNEYLNRVEEKKLFKKGRPEDRRPLRKKQIFIVHRLDQDTSGLLMFAKNEEIKHRLQDHWKKVRKKYWAVVEGTPGKNSGTVTSFLRQTQTLKVTSGPEQRGSKSAVTHYRVVRSGESHSLLEIDLETGRKHQIRVHLADLGHPVVGDEKYGNGTDPVGRLALHAHSLAFPHPLSGEPMVFQSDLPPVLKGLVP